MTAGRASGTPSGTVGVIGLGAMGAACARNLVGKGHRVVGYDRDPAAGLLDEELRALVGLADRDDLAQHPHREARRRVEAVVLVLEELPGAVEQDRGEDEQHRGEAADDGDAEREEDAADRLWLGSSSRAAKPL